LPCARCLRPACHDSADKGGAAPTEGGRSGAPPGDAPGVWVWVCRFRAPWTGRRGDGGHPDRAAARRPHDDSDTQTFEQSRPGPRGLKLAMLLVTISLSKGIVSQCLFNTNRIAVRSAALARHSFRHGYRHGCRHG